jgi:hypothetical protein
MKRSAHYAVKVGSGNIRAAADTVGYRFCGAALEPLATVIEPGDGARERLLVGGAA